MNGLMKQKRNIDFKWYVSNAEPFNEELTLLHTAAEWNNVEVLECLCNAGYDINTRNSQGQTALMIALLKNNLPCVEYLLTLDADLFVIDAKGKSALKICLRKKRRFPENTIAKIFERLKRYDLNVEQIAEQLIKAGCSLQQALLINDANVLALLLNQQVFINSNDSMTLLKAAMKSNFLHNVKTVLKHGPDKKARLKEFYRIIIDNRFDPRNKPFIEQLVNWKIVTKSLARQIGWIFQTETSMKIIKMFLNIGIVDYVRKKFNWDLLVKFFVEFQTYYGILMENEIFDPNGLDPDGRSAFHVAVLHSNMIGINYLLHIGADPNVRCREGKTPLFYTKNEIVVEILLDSGSDFQLVDDEGATCIDKFPSKWILASICIIEARGLPLNDKIRDAMDRCDYWNKFDYIACRSDIKWTKTQTIFEGTTVFSILVSKAEETARYVTDKNSITKIIETSRRGARTLHSPLDEMLKKNLDRAALVFVQLKSKAAGVIASIMNIACSDHLVIRQIINYLTYDDLRILNTLESI